MMLIDNKYNLGEIVFLLTDPEQKEYLVCGITIRPSLGLIYSLCHSSGPESDHYDIEITREPDILKKTEA